MRYAAQSQIGKERLVRLEIAVSTFVYVGCFVHTSDLDSGLRVSQVPPKILTLIEKPSFAGTAVATFRPACRFYAWELYTTDGIVTTRSIWWVSIETGNVHRQGFLFPTIEETLQLSMEK